MVALAKPEIRFTEVELSSAENAEFEAMGAIDDRHFVAQVADGEVCAYVSKHKGSETAKPTWHISVSVSDRENERGIFRWPMPDELMACMLLTGQVGCTKFSIFSGETPYIVHIAEVEQPRSSRTLPWRWCLLAAAGIITIATLLAASWR